MNHRAIILWALDVSKEILPLFETDYPEDKRPRESLEAAMLWSKGEIKMPVARRFALASHQAANEHPENPKAEAAARVMGHALGTVHVETHALGVVFYGLTAIHHAYDESIRDKKINDMIEWMTNKLMEWTDKEKHLQGRWASFLLKDPEINKEKELRIKMEQRKE